MFEKATAKPNLVPRAVVIELRDGRRYRGVLQLRRQENAASLLGKANEFLTIRTSKGDIAFARDMIASLVLSDAGEGRAGSSFERRKPESRRRPCGQQPNDPCRILDVRPGASREELKSAWRRKIRECHPDRLAGEGYSDEAVMAAQQEAARVNMAYRTLVSARST